MPRTAAPTLADRSANLAALWRAVLRTGTALEADPTNETLRLDYLDAKQAWRDAS